MTTATKRHGGEAGQKRDGERDEDGNVQIQQRDRHPGEYSQESHDPPQGKQPQPGIMLHGRAVVHIVFEIMVHVAGPAVMDVQRRIMVQIRVEVVTEVVIQVGVAVMAQAEQQQNRLNDEDQGRGMAMIYRTCSSRPSWLHHVNIEETSIPNLSTRFGAA